MSRVALSANTRRLVERLFHPRERSPIEAMLENECGANLPFMNDATPDSLERVRFAVLKLSGGSLSTLGEAIALAKADWRDVLAAAHFADDIQSHAVWFHEQGDGAFDG